MILFDTETTGRPQPGLVPLDQQPEIIEFAAVVLNDDTLEEEDHLIFTCKPKRLPLPDIITRITGITTFDVQSQKPFAGWLPQVVDFFLGERTLVAHNAEFDCTMLQFELRRLGCEFYFPWPPQRVCTVETTKHLFEKFPTEDVLYEHLIGKKRSGKSHRALQDVRDLADCVRVMRREGLL